MPCVDELVKMYLGNKKNISFLANKHSVVQCVVVSIRTLKKFCWKRLFRRKNHTGMEEVSTFMQAEIERT